MASGTYMSADELMEEISFQRVLLQTIDDSVIDRPSAVAAVNEEIKSLEAALQSLRGNKEGKDSVPQPTFPNSNVYTNPFEDDKSTQAWSLSDASPEQTTASTVSYSDATLRDSDDADILSIQKRQREAARRIRQEKNDAEYARQLQAEGTPEPTSAYPPPRSSQTATPAGFQTAYDRMVTKLSKAKVDSSARANDFAQPCSGTGARGSIDQHKSDQLFDKGSSSTCTMRPYSAREVASSMRGGFPKTESSDSEIEVVSADQFSPSARSAKRKPFTMIPVHQQARSTYLPYHGGHILNPSLAAGNSSQNFRRQASSRWPIANGPVIPQQQVTGSSSAALEASQPNFIRMGSQASNQAAANLTSAYGRPGYLQNGLAPSQDLNGGFRVYGSRQSGFGDLATQTAVKDPMAAVLAHASSIDYSNMSAQAAINLEYALNDPRNTDEQLRELLMNISNDVDIPKKDREGTPASLKYPLYEHQKLALTWLRQMEEGSNKGGILADDMGLGKTISALALMLSRQSDDNARKTNLIVGPVALIKQWEREIKTKTKAGNQHQLFCFIFHGGQKQSWTKLKDYDVVLTTYGTLAAEWKRLLAWEERKRENPGIDTSDEVTRLPFLGAQSKWYRVILDEAQCIKNKGTKAALACAHLKALYRFCLTGTPMMNGVHELASLIHFLRIRPYSDHTRFSSEFGTLTRNSKTQDWKRDSAMKKLQAVLKAIMLRRTKTSLIDGNPILILPPKTEEIVHVYFNEEEAAYYDHLAKKTLLQVNKYVRAGTVGKNYSNMLVLLLRLRQAACHPHLIMDFDVVDSDVSEDEMLELAKSLEPNVVRQIIERIVEATGGAMECVVCNDVANLRIVTPCGHDTCSECLVRIVATSQEAAIQQGQDAEGGNARCATCRGKLEMKKVIDFPTFKKCHMPEEEDNNATSSEDSQSDDEVIGEDSDTESVAEDDGADLEGFIVADDEMDDEDLAPPSSIKQSSRHQGMKEEVAALTSSGHTTPAVNNRKGKSKHAPMTEVHDDISDDDVGENRAPFKRRRPSNTIESSGSDVEPPLKQKRVKTDEAQPYVSEDRSDLDLPAFPIRRQVQKSKVKGRAVAKKPGAKARTKVDKNENGKDMDEGAEDSEPLGYDDTERNLDHYFSRKPRKTKKKSTKSKKPLKPQHVNLAMMKKEATKNAHNKKIYMDYLKTRWESSSKTDKCIEILQATDDDVKTIIFSQFTTFLDLLEIPIKREFGHCYRRYDGSMSTTARNDAIVDFTDKPHIKIMLVSLKAGNAGLNLVAASQVIIMDPFWNPYVEMQAVDRAYRIGQLKPVKVYRIIVQGTVEDRILDLQEKKRALVDAALDEKASKGLGRLGQAELVSLFGSGNEERHVQSRVNPLTAHPSHARTDL